MAFLVLVASTGFSMNAHFCQDQLKGVSFIGEAETCHDKQANTKCHHAENMTDTEKDNCCDNKQIVAENLDTEAIAQQLVIQNEIQIEFVAAFLSVFMFNELETNHLQHVPKYRPPILDRDLPVLHQVFLI